MKHDKEIELIYETINRIFKRINSLEVKNESNELHEKINFACNIANSWKILDIDNLPERFFIRDDIELQFKSIGDSIQEWINDNLTIENRYYVIKRVNEKTVKAYRYRIQEKKPIQITREMLEDLRRYREIIGKENTSVRLAKYYGREVIIID